MKHKDLKGQSFGRLTVLSYAGSKNGRVIWNCRCECGETKVATTNNLQSGNTSSCGCYRRDVQSQLKTKHGQARNGRQTSEYRIWAGMVSRCYDKNNKKYPCYGGRGIAVCPRWLNSFENFFEDMGERPPGTSIDRIDNNGNYCSNNCRWATAIEQGRNSRSNRLLTINGETKNVSEWAEIAGMPYNTLKSRLRYGWSMDKILSPVTREGK